MALYTDLKYLRDLTDDDEELINESLKRYINTSPLQLEKLIKNTEDKNWEEIHNSAHSLFGTTQIVGLTVIAKPLKDIQHICRDAKEYMLIKEKVDFVVDIIRISYSEINNYLKTSAYQ